MVHILALLELLAVLLAHVVLDLRTALLLVVGDRLNNHSIILVTGLELMRVKAHRPPPGGAS